MLGALAKRADDRLPLIPSGTLTMRKVGEAEVTRGAERRSVQQDRGSIAPGKAADLILVDGDATRDISALRNIAMVLKGDRAYYPSEVYSERGVRPFAEPLRFAAGSAGGVQVIER